MTAQDEELIGLLQKVRELYPDWRWGQLVANVAALAGDTEPLNVCDVTDEELLRAAREHLRRRGVDVAA